MTRFLVTFAAWSLALLAWVLWRWVEDARADEARKAEHDRAVAYSRWATWQAAHAPVRRPGLRRSRSAA